MTHILVVDDSPTDLHAIKTILEENGFETTTVASGEEGLVKAKEIKPDLIIMDVLLPGLNGFQVTRKITRDPDTSNIPVILVSVKSMESDKVWGIRQGAKEYVTKPFSRGELMSAINQHLA